MRLPFSYLLLILATAALPTAADNPSSDPSSDEVPKRDKPGTQCNVILGATLAGVGLATIIGPAVILGPGLAAVGFGPLGPIAGALAPTIQAAAGPVVAHGLFATFQSAAMGGYGVAAVTGGIQGVGAAMTAAGAALIVCAAPADDNEAREEK